MSYPSLKRIRIIITHKQINYKKHPLINLLLRDRHNFFICLAALQERVQSEERKRGKTRTKKIKLKVEASHCCFRHYFEMSLVKPKSDSSKSKEMRVLNYSAKASSLRETHAWMFFI